MQKPTSFPQFAQKFCLDRFDTNVELVGVVCMEHCAPPAKATPGYLVMTFAARVDKFKSTATSSSSSSSEKQTNCVHQWIKWSELVAEHHSLVSMLNFEEKKSTASATNMSSSSMDVAGHGYTVRDARDIQFPAGLPVFPLSLLALEGTPYKGALQ